MKKMAIKKDCPAEKLKKDYPQHLALRHRSNPQVIDFYYNGMKYEKAVWNNPLH